MPPAAARSRSSSGVAQELQSRTQTPTEVTRRAPQTGTSLRAAIRTSTSATRAPTPGHPRPARPIPTRYLYRTRGTGRRPRPSYSSPHVTLTERPPTGSSTDARVHDGFHGRSRSGMRRSAMAERGLSPGLRRRWAPTRDSTGRSTSVERACVELGVVPHVPRRAKHSAILEEVARIASATRSVQRRLQDGPERQIFGLAKDRGGRAQAPLPSANRSTASNGWRWAPPRTTWLHRLTAPVSTPRELSRA